MADRPGADHNGIGHGRLDWLASGWGQAVALVAIVVGAVALRFPLLGGGQLDYDEGVYWESVRSLQSGHRMFTEVYSSQPPGFLLGLEGAAALGGATLTVLRGTVMLTWVLGIVAGNRLATRLAGPNAGVVVAMLLAVDPTLLRSSVTLQADVPAAALALMALALAVEATAHGGRRGTLEAVLSGVTLALAVLVKLSAIIVVAPLAVALLGSRRSGETWQRARGSVAAAAGGAALAAAVVLLPFASSWREVYDQSIGLHLDSRGVVFGGIDTATWGQEAAVALLAVAGIAAAVGVAAIRRLAGVGLAWTVAGALVLALGVRPVFTHHLAVVIPGLALLGGCAGAWLTAHPALRRRAAMATAAAVVAVAALAGGILAAAQVGSAQQPASARRQGLAAAVRPGTYLVSDDPFDAAALGLDLPPELVDTSVVRVLSGSLTPSGVESRIARGDVSAVMLATGRLDRLTGLRAWIVEHLAVISETPDGAMLAVRRP